MGMLAGMAREGIGQPISLVTADDVLWFLYLYPLRVLAAFSSPRLIERVGRLFSFRDKERKELAASRILTARSVGVGREEAGRIAGRWVENSKARMMDDLILSWGFRRRKLLCEEMAGFEYIKNALAAGKGVIVLTAHLFATRLGKRYLANLGYPMLTVRDRTTPGDWWGHLGRGLLEPRRQAFLRRVIGEAVHTDDRDCTLKIFQRLRAGGMVHIHFDGRSGKRLVPWRLLGVERSFASGVFEIVRLSGCAVVPMMCAGGSRELRIRFAPALEIKPAGDREEFVRANLPAFVESIEEQIQAHPEEWEEWISF